MQCREGKAPGCALDAGDPLHLRHTAGSKAELRGREEVVAREVRAWLAEVAQPEAGRTVLLLELCALALREPAARARPRRLTGREADRPRHRQVGADPGERFQHRRLRIVEAGRQCADGDDESDADREAERGEDRAAASPSQLAEDVRNVEDAS